MFKKKLPHLLLICYCLTALAITISPGELNGIASGSIYLTSNDLATTGAVKVYSVTFNNPPGTTPVGYAFGI